MKVLFVVFLSFFSPRPVERCYQAPVIGSLVDPFRNPDCPYCAGNRGLEYRTVAGSAVAAVAPGTASFVGVVVDTRYVVIIQDDGLVATYGMLSSSSVRRGDRIVARQVLGTTSASFYFGLRNGGVYIDPAPFIGRTVYQPRLVPLDGSVPRPATATGLRCATP